MTTSEDFELDDDFALDPEPQTAETFELTPPPEVIPDPPTAAEIATAFSPSLPLMEVLPADFPLPVLARFVPDVRLKTDVDEATRYALSIDVRGVEGLQAADLALSTLRTSLKGITDHFAEPADIAHQLHKRITGIRSEWTADGENALKVVGRRIYAEGERLRVLAEAERRKAQVEADRLAREEARRRVEEAAQAKAPARVVEEMTRQAETTTAPPVPPPASTPPPLRGSAPVKTWKARIAGSPAEADPNPSIAELTAAQKAEVWRLLIAIVNSEGDAPLSCIELNWKYLNDRAKSDKSTLAIPGIEAFADGGLRAKASRPKR